jgi:hypothetical protein
MSWAARPEHMSERPNFEGVYGDIINPLRLMYMMGLVWRLAQDGRTALNMLEVGSWCGSSALTLGEAVGSIAKTAGISFASMLGSPIST